MPELPEVETVKESLKSKVIGRKIIGVNIFYSNVISSPSIEEFKDRIINQKIINIKRRGKWLLFELDKDYLLSHLRMEGKYFIRNSNEKTEKHEHISFILDNGEELRYHDTRKFGRMYLINKEEVYNVKPLSELGLEPWDDLLTTKYLADKFSKKRLPIKTVLLDQSIITGIGNIYDDEILFMSNINPLTKANELSKKDLENIIKNTRIVLEKAIKLGGTTIKSYSTPDGHHGKFQNSLLVHGKVGEKCPVCNTDISKIKVGGRGTYYCKICQK